MIELEMIEVEFNRLLDMANIQFDYPFQWNTNDTPILCEQVIAHKLEGITGTSRPFGDTWRYPVKEQLDRQYHIERIIYFMEHPEEINGIDVDNKWCPRPYLAILPACEIVDGWHRIAAAMCLGIEKVFISYGGRGDIEDYLTGKSDDRPYEILVL